MGNTEWALLVRSDDDIRYWLQVAREHNQWEDLDEVGEPLVVTCILNYVTKSKAANPTVPSGKYLLLVNGGGRSYTMSFLRQRQRPGDVILGLGDKPSNWLDCQDFVWQSNDVSEANATPNIPRIFN